MCFIKNKRKNSCTSVVNINGKTIRVNGSKIAVVNDQIIVDGRVLNESMDCKNITVIVEGDCHTLRAYGNVEVKGNCSEVDCSGSCHIAGNV